MTTTGGRLDRHAVVDAAEHLVDRAGWDGISMTALAAELGVRVPSLYNHVRSLDDVRGAVQVRTMHQLGEELRSAAMGRAGEDGVRALAQVVRSFARRHPQRYEATTRAPIDRPAFMAASLDANEALGSMLRSQGADGETTLYAEAAVFAAVHGFVMLEISGFLGDRLDPDRLFAKVVDGALASLAG